MNKFTKMLNVLKSYTYIKNTMCVLVCLLCINVASAQTDSLIKAQFYYSNKNNEKALKLIEKCIQHPETKEDAYTWQFRAFLYRDLFQPYSKEITLSKSYLLDSIVSSCLNSLKFDKQNEYKVNNIKLIESASKSYYKIAVKYINDSTIRNFEIAQKSYNKYKSILLKVQPNYNFTSEDINFYGVVGGIYANLYVNAEFDNKFGEIAKSALFLVLDLDPQNISANLNMGIVYYNQGATLIKKMDTGETGISELYVIQDNAAKLFNQSLPYMKNVFALNPNEKRALEGLAGIYDGLNDKETSKKFIKLKESLDQNNKK